MKVLGIAGWFDLTQAVVLRTHYEVACWYRDALVQPGRYLIEACRTSWAPHKPFFAVRLPGTLVSVDNGALFGGVSMTSRPQGTQHEEVGQAHEHVLSFEPEYMATHVKEGHYLLVGQQSTRAECPIHLFAQEVGTTRRWLQWNEGVYNERGRRISDSPRGYWYERHYLRTPLALPART